MAGLSLNLYVYAGNDPINFIDASGREADWIQRGMIVLTAVMNQLATWFSPMPPKPLAPTPPAVRSAVPLPGSPADEPLRNIYLEVDPEQVQRDIESSQPEQQRPAAVPSAPEGDRSRGPKVSIDWTTFPRWIPRYSPWLGPLLVPLNPRSAGDGEMEWSHRNRWALRHRACPLSQNPDPGAGAGRSW